MAQRARHARNQEIGFPGERAGGQCIALWLRGGRVAAGMNTSVWDMNDHVQALARSHQAVVVAAVRRRGMLLLLSRTSTATMDRPVMAVLRRRRDVSI
jgi:hypothetical protein